MHTIEAIFTGGVFRPVTVPPADIADGQYVLLDVRSPVDALELAAQVYQGLTPEAVDDLEHLILERRDFFGAAT